MREIKFRALNSEDELIYGLPYTDSVNETAYYKEYNNRLCWRNKDGASCNQPYKNGTLMQYTGIKDKNGVEIYEGDMFQIPYITPMGDITDGVDGELIKVEFKNGMFGYFDGVRFNSLEDYIMKEKGEYISNKGNLIVYGCFIGSVIGNIYENKEILND